MRHVQYTIYLHCLRIQSIASWRRIDGSGLKPAKFAINLQASFATHHPLSVPIRFDKVEIRFLNWSPMIMIGPHTPLVHILSKMLLILPVFFPHHQFPTSIVHVQFLRMPSSGMSSGQWARSMWRYPIQKSSEQSNNELQWHFSVTYICKVMQFVNV